MSDEIKKETVEEETVTIKKSEYDNLIQTSKNNDKVVKAFNKLMDLYLKQYSSQLIADLLKEEE